MTQAAFERGDWQAVIDAHPLESHDVEEWLRYGISLLQTIDAGPEGGKQQQQAALAFAEARKLGASAGALSLAQRYVIHLSLQEAMGHLGLAVPHEAARLGPLKRVLLVLGMHRSGTSALAGLLCQLGFQAPDDLEPADAHNPTGFWEPRKIRAFHTALMDVCQSSWDDPLLPVLSWHPHKEGRAIDDLEQALAADFPAADPKSVALIKDPRQCRLLPIWTALFEQRPFQAGVVLVVRNPAAVAASLARREHLPTDRSLLLWLSHTLESERHTRKLPRLVISYEQLLEDPAGVVQRCQQLVGLPRLPLSDQLRNKWIHPNYNHHRNSSDLELNHDVKDLLELALTVYQAMLGSLSTDESRSQLDRAYQLVHERLLGLREQGSRRGTVQLFWEPAKGGGYTEDESQKHSVLMERGAATVSFQLPVSAAQPRSLRLDIAEEPGMVTLLGIELRADSGELIWKWRPAENGDEQNVPLPVSTVNPETLLMKNAVVLAVNADPGLVLDIPQSALDQLGPGSEVLVEGLWQPLPLHIAMQLAQKPDEEKLSGTYHETQ